MTHTYAILPVSQRTWDEIAKLLREADYQHVFDGDIIDMHGIAIQPATQEVAPPKHEQHRS